MKIPTASQKNPFAFFEFILSNKHGINSLKKEFLPSQEDLEYYGNKLSYNNSTEEKVLITFNNISGEEEIEVYKFRDVLYKRIEEEYSRCISAIDVEILGIQDKGRIGVYINVIFERLNYFRNSLKSLSNIFSKYPELNKFPEALESLLKEKYAYFITDDSQTFDSLINELKGVPLKKDARPSIIRGFTWTKGDSIDLTKKLFDFLSENEFINCTLEQLSMAFCDNVIDQPLNIKWLDDTKSKSHVNKVSLLYLYQQLSERGMIDTEFGSKDMIDKITHIFVDRNGLPIKNFNQSISTLNKSNAKKSKKTWSKNLIDDFISAILY